MRRGSEAFIIVEQIVVGADRSVKVASFSNDTTPSRGALPMDVKEVMESHSLVEQEV